MFSYSVNVRKISNPKLKAICSLIIDGVLVIDGFKIINGSNGLFVSVPSHKGTIMEDGQQVEKYFDDIRFMGDNAGDVAREIKDAIIAAYNSDSPASVMSGSTPSSKQTSSEPTSQKAVKAANLAAKQKAQAAAPKSSDSAPKKPLWGF